MDPLSWKRQFQQFVLFVCYWILILNFWGSRDSSVISSHYWVSILAILDFYCVMVLYPRSDIPKMMWVTCFEGRKEREGEWWGEKPWWKELRMLRAGRLHFLSAGTGYSRKLTSSQCSAMPRWDLWFSLQEERRSTSSPIPGVVNVYFP